MAPDAQKATFHGPPGGTVYRARGSTLIFKARGADTAGAFSLMERALPPNGRPPAPHTHPRTQEAFYVLAGMIHVSAGTEQLCAAAGDFVLVPAGLRHTFSNRESAPTHVLILHAPALDEYFADFHQLSRAPTWDAAAELAIMRRHGLEPAE